MKRLPLVTIVMPCYNSERYVAAAVVSVIQQTYQRWKLIVVDDDSTDQTADIIKNYAKKDKRIRLIQQKVNGKQWRARNIALNQACNNGSSYFCSLDSDDLLEPEKLARQVQFLQEHPSIGAVGSGFDYIDEFGKKTQAPIPTKDITNDTAIHRIMIAQPSLMIRLTIIKQHQLLFRPFLIGEDTDFFLRLKSIAPIHNLHHEIHYHYRRHANNSTRVHLIALIFGELVRYSAIARSYLGYDLLPEFKNILEVSKNPKQPDTITIQFSDLPQYFKIALQNKKLQAYSNIFLTKLFIGLIYDTVRHPFAQIPNFWQQRETWRKLFGIIFKYQTLASLRALCFSILKNFFRFTFYYLFNKNRKENFFIEG